MLTPHPEEKYKRSNEFDNMMQNHKIAVSTKVWFVHEETDHTSCLFSQWVMTISRRRKSILFFGFIELQSKIAEIL